MDGWDPIPVASWPSVLGFRPRRPPLLRQWRLPRRAAGIRTGTAQAARPTILHWTEPDPLAMAWTGRRPVWAAGRLSVSTEAQPCALNPLACRGSRVPSAGQVPTCGSQHTAEPNASVHHQPSRTQCSLCTPVHSACGKPLEPSWPMLLHNSQGRTHLALDDMQEKVWVTAAAQQVAKAQGLVEGLHLVQDVRGWPPGRASVCHREHKSEGHTYNTGCKYCKATLSQSCRAKQLN